MSRPQSLHHFITTYHSVQFCAFVALLLYPFGHSVHPELPVLFWYVPVEHGRQKVEPDDV